jgi:hypothetical protein
VSGLMPGDPWDPIVALTGNAIGVGLGAGLSGPLSEIDLCTPWQYVWPSRAEARSRGSPSARSSLMVTAGKRRES